MKALKILSILILCAAGLFSCTKDSGMPAVAVEVCDTISYVNEIRPIVNSKCMGCHTSGFASGDFTTYEVLKEKADNGRLYQTVVVDKSMPDGDVLSAEELKKFKCWLENGAPNN